MSKTTSIFSALLCTLIWGTTFIAQETGMEFIGPYVFNGVRFFVGFLALIPFYFLIERKKIKHWNPVETKKELPKNIILKPIDEFGIDGDFIESQAFAFLGIRSLLKLPISFPQTTGVKKPCTGGIIIKN